MTFPLADVVAFAALVSLIVYALLGGADFGGGLWDLLARGPRAEKQRELISEAIAPVWEANHVWLILVIVILFTGFPVAYSVMLTALHIPVTLMLLGIVLRGSAFAFRHYDTAGPSAQQRWGRIFAISSAVTPLFLGIIVGALTAGRIPTIDGIPISGFIDPWLGWFPFFTGLFALALFTFLAAVYLTNETPDPELQNDFRLRALGSGVAVAVTALAAALAAGQGTLHFSDRLFNSPWSWPLQILTGGAAVSAFGFLWTRRYRWARAAAVAQVTLILLGWGLAQYPYLIAPDITVASAAAPTITLQLLLGGLVLGSLLLFPSLYYLMRVFKGRRAFENLEE